MNNKIAIIDFCGTLVKIQTADKFVLFVIKRNPIKLLQFSVIYLYQKISTILKTNILKISLDKTIYLNLLKGYKYKKIVENAKKYATKLYIKYQNRNVIEIIKDINCDKNIIVSAGYFEYIKEFVDLLPINIASIHASEFIYRENIFTGKINRSVYAEDKVNLLNQKENIFKYDYNNISVFTDSISDLPIIKLGKTIYCVNPDDKLKKLALMSKWKIIV